MRSSDPWFKGLELTDVLLALDREPTLTGPALDCEPTLTGPGLDSGFLTQALVFVVAGPQARWQLS